MEVTRVLITDDDPISLMLIQEVLQTLPVLCITASSVAEANRIILSEPPQIAILDVQLPDGDGTQILLEIRARELPTSVAFVTASLQEFPFHKCASYQPDMLFAKPIDPEAIRAWVEKSAVGSQLSAA